MFSLIYISLIKVDFDINEMVELAIEKNTMYSVTGYLCLIDNHFIQYLEGEEQDVRNLMANIEKDDRHKVINIVYTDFKHRLFANWAMLFNDLNKYQKAEIKIQHLLKNLILHLKLEILPEEIMQMNIQRMIKKIAILAKEMTRGHLSKP